MHAPFSPSAAERWIACPGSHLPSRLIPALPESSYAAEGTRRHDLAAKFIRDGQPHHTALMAADDYNLLKPYLNLALSMREISSIFRVEQELRYDENLFGTADLIALTKRTLHVVDLKTGQGVQVDPMDNPQLLTYAWLALQDDELALEAIELDDVVLTIAQPPIEGGPCEIRSWACPVDRVIEHGELLKSTMEVALAPNAPLNPGEHCRWCRLKPSCPALTGAAREAVLALPALAGFTPVQLSEWLDKADLLQTFIDGLRERAHQAVSEGYVIPGYALKPKRATRQWANPLAVVEFARERKMKIFKDPELMSPAQAEKAYPKGLPDPIKSQIVSVSSGTNLVKSEVPNVIPAGPRPLGEALASLIYRT